MLEKHSYFLSCFSRGYNSIDGNIYIYFIYELYNSWEDEKSYHDYFLFLLIGISDKASNNFDPRFDLDLEISSPLHNFKF